MHINHNSFEEITLVNIIAYATQYLKAVASSSDKDMIFVSF